MLTDDQLKKKRAKAREFLKKEFEIDQPLDDRKLERKRQRKVKYLRRIINRFLGRVQIMPTYERMIDWCDDQDQKPNLRRLDNWLTKRLEWDNEKRQAKTEGEPIDEQRKRTKEFLDRFG